MNFIGIDTSAYTTSLAIVDVNKNLLWEGRRILNVPHGERGLAQSEAFFQHVQNLPLILEEIPKSLWENMMGIGVSIAPRPIQGSYMPVFTAGFATAKAIAVAARIPLIMTTHQEGHIAAGLASASQELASSEFLAVHLSGGTTELLRVKRIVPGKFAIDLIGGTTDLHAGQFVDRVGVLLGLDFPAGRNLEILAREANLQAASIIPSSVQDFKVSFSGAETAAKRLVMRGTPAADVGRAVEGCIARTVSKLVLNGIAQTSCRDVLLVGGVASNFFIREEIKRRIGTRGNIAWAVSEWSRDNAIGVALLTQEQVITMNHKG